jgi:putative ABC transport system permease protein
MRWFVLGFKNMLRRPTRSALTVLGVAIAIAVLYSLYEFQRGYQERLKAELGAMGAQVMVVPKGCPYEAATIALHGGKWPRYIDESTLAKVKSQSGVAAAAGVIMDAVTDSGGRNLIILGIDRDYMALRPAWRITGSWFDSDTSAIVGSSVASELDLTVGSPFTIPGKPQRLRVSGVLARTNTQDDGFVFLPMKTHQEMFDLRGKLVVILIRAAQVDRADQLVAALRAADVNMNVFPLSELLNTISDLMASTKVFVSAIIIIALLVGAMGVLNTILMAVFERTREIGMMKAMGARASDVFKLIWAETVLTTTAGGIVGLLLALGSSRLVEAIIRGMIPFAPNGSLINVVPLTIVACTLLSLALGVLAGLYPALRAAMVKPVVAMRSE